MKRCFGVVIGVLILFINVSTKAQESTPLESLVDMYFDNGEVDRTELFTPLESSDLENTVSEYVVEFNLLTINEQTLNNLLQQRPQTLLLTIPVPGQPDLELKLVRQSVQSDEFMLQALSDDFESSEINYRPALHYRGIVNGQAHSLACLSLFDDHAMGVFTTSEGGWVIGQTGPAGNTYVLYRDDIENMLIENGFHCGVDDPEYGTHASEESGGGSTGYATRCLQLYFECDYSLYQAKGNSITTAADYVMGIYNIVAALYYNEGISTKISRISVWTSTCPYDLSTISTTLDDFKSIWHWRANNGVYFGADLAHFLTVDKNWGGLAKLDGLCHPATTYATSDIYDNTYLASIPVYSWSVGVIAHEIGHNIGSPHTHACYWNGNWSSIDDCGPAAGYFEPPIPPFPCPHSPLLIPVKGTIMSYCHLLTGIGIDFGLGFGSQPGDLLRDKISNAPCLTTCSCLPFLILSGSVTISTLYTYDVSDSITSVQTITPSTTGGIYYKAKRTTLLPGFQSENGSRFIAQVAPCEPAIDVAYKQDQRGYTQTSKGLPLIIYPNPSNRLFHIEGPQQGRLLIYNRMGQVVHEIEQWKASMEIDLPDMSKDLYFIEVVEPDGRIHIGRIILQ